VKRIRNVIFDLDGTLVDSSDGVVESVNYSLRQIGAPEQRPEVIKPYIGYSLDKMYPAFTDAPLVELVGHFRIKAAEVMVDCTTGLPGADETLHTLHDAGYNLAIATTKIQQHLQGIIHKFGWADIIAATVGADDVSREKPDPEAIRLALKRLGAGSASSVMVGDTVNDVLAAKGAGLNVIAIASPFEQRDVVIGARPDHFIGSIRDLPDLLKSRM
jgi:phosphoglycolate phosphatase-like HAD superfamily hydrolase